MSWWEDADTETRVLIAPDAVGESNGKLLSLRHPKTGASTTYLFTNGSLQEINWFKKSYGSWFLGDYVCEDGSLYASTPIDPIFIMLPIFDEARMKKRDDPGKFRQVDDILYVDGYPGYQHLLLIVERCMHVVCEVKEIGSMKFFRLNDAKVLAWLSQKYLIASYTHLLVSGTLSKNWFEAVYKLKQTLFTLDKNYAAQDENHTLADAVSILSEYLKDEPWMKLLCNHLSLDIPDMTKRTASSDVCSPFPEMQPLSGSSIQEKEAKDKKTAKNGRQAKKMKVEKDSKNIKDMFTRATRSGARAKLNMHDTCGASIRETGGLS